MIELSFIFDATLLNWIYFFQKVCILIFFFKENTISWLTKANPDRNERHKQFWLKKVSTGIDSEKKIYQQTQ